MYLGMNTCRIGSLSSEGYRSLHELLKKWHILKNCRAPLMCKKCTKHHHTLLDKDADYLPQRKSENEEGNKDYVATLSVSEQVLVNDLQGGHCVCWS